jgi:hypothetical protein
MNKVMTSLLMTAAISAAMISCKKDKDDAPAPTLSISPSQSAVVFNADGTPDGNAVFAVATNQSAWDAVSSQTWCKVTKNAGGFTVSADANLTTTAPTPATVTVTATGATAIVIIVTQAGADLTAAKAALQAAIDAATAARNAVLVTTTPWAEGTQAAGTYIIDGSGDPAALPVGLYYIAANPVPAMEAAITAAQIALAGAATAAELETATTALATATAAFNTALAGATEGTLGLAARIAAASSPVTIYLYGDEDDFAGILTSVYNITKTITLQGVGAVRTISLASNGYMFRIDANSTLTLNANVTLAGKSGNNASVVIVYNPSAVFTMNDGSKITGNVTSTESGAVHLYQGQFIMNGGEITGNSTTNTGYRATGGVLLNSSYTLTMNGGSITGNTGGAGDVSLWVGSNLALSGNAAIGTLALSTSSGSYSNSYVPVAIASGWNGGNITLNLAGNDATMSNVIGFFANKQLIKEATGYTLTATDIGKFTLGNFRSSTAGATQSIGSTHKLGTTGADVGKLILKQ